MTYPPHTSGYYEYKHCLVWGGNPLDEPKLNATEAYQLLRKSNAWMLRNNYDFDCGEKTNFWEIINDTPRKIEELPSKVRNQVRRSMRDCYIIKVTSLQLVHDNGYEVYKRSFERYRSITTNIVEREQWERSILVSQNYEFFGVYRRTDNLLIAYAQNSISGNKVNYNTLKAIPEYLGKHYPYFGLLFEMNRYYLEEKCFSYVSDGMRSITEHSNIQPFLEKNFLFRKAYCRVSIYYKYWLKLCVNLAYPFRGFIPFNSIKHLLNIETIRREK